MARFLFFPPIQIPMVIPRLIKISHITMSIYSNPGLSNKRLSRDRYISSICTSSRTHIRLTAIIVYNFWNTREYIFLMTLWILLHIFIFRTKLYYHKVVYLILCKHVNQFSKNKSFRRSRLLVIRIYWPALTILRTKDETIQSWILHQFAEVPELLGQSRCLKYKSTHIIRYFWVKVLIYVSQCYDFLKLRNDLYTNHYHERQHTTYCGLQKR